MLDYSDEVVIEFKSNVGVFSECIYNFVVDFVWKLILFDRYVNILFLFFIGVFDIVCKF